jgi:CMP-N-acetylneuraminic acid synthetase
MVEEETVKRVLVVIPARGGSKGIPRKNLRLLGGRPLIYYTITNALNSSYVTDVYVSSEDDEILALSQRFGAKIHRRDPAIADDRTTLDPVIYDTYMYAQNIEGKVYDLIVTLQPTSPLLKTISLDSAISRMLENDRIDTIISVKDATHLSWRKENGRFIPNYKERLNRQYLTPTFTETGVS